MKNDKSKILGTVIILGILFLIIDYLLVFKKFMAKADELKASNAVLNERVTELRGYYVNLKTYEEEIDKMSTRIKSWLTVFPADILEEDIFVLSLDTQEDAQVIYNNYSISEKEDLIQIDAETVKAAGMLEYEEEIDFFKKVATYNCSLNYGNLKSVIEKINSSASKNRLAIDGVTFTKNKETGFLDGTIDMAFYSVKGTGAQYVPVTVPEYEEGLPDLFSNVASIVELEDEDAARKAKEAKEAEEQKDDANTK